MRFSFCILFFITFSAFSQSQFTFGWLPKVNVSNKLSKNVKWVNSVEARESVYKNKLELKHTLVDVSTIFSFKTNVNQSFNVGYIIRFREGVVIHRFLQHYNLLHHVASFTVSHRFGLEQFYQTTITPQYRTRYRVTVQKSLSGEKVDVKEWYLKFANEYLYQFNKADFEIRFSPYLGYQLNNENKIEVGLDYRLGSVLTDNLTNNLWFRTTWYISL